jgi:hypothetical protein
MSNTFASMNCDDEQLAHLSELRIIAEDMEALILEAVIADDHNGVVSSERAGKIARYRSLAMTHLETAILFANKGITRRTL